MKSKKESARAAATATGNKGKRHLGGASDCTTARGIVATAALTLLSLAGVRALLQVAYVVQAARWGWC